MRFGIILLFLVGCGQSDPVQTPKKETLQPTTASAGSSDSRIVFGSSYLALPDGWKEVKREPERVTFLNADDTEQATVSKLDFAAAPSFEDFKVICEDRLAAERQASKDASLNVTGPLNEGKHFTFMYSGSEKETRRLFSGYIVVVEKTVMTVYLEGIGVTGERHVASFKAFVTGFRP